jgi:prephenate dehydratase
VTTVAYLGPPGTFSEDALLVSDVPSTDLEPVPLATVHDVVLAVQDGRADRGIVPIESAAEGSVDATLDALATEAPDVSIIAEVVLPVRHALIARDDLELAAVAVVVSHPQALAQCTAFLRAELPAARAVAWTSTAEAVRAAIERGDERWAGIGTERAASLYGGQVLRAGIEDIAGNATRFVWLAPSGTPVEGAEKTSLVFSGTGAQESGWLVRCLSEFAFRGVNLTRIESRPRRDRLGDYRFFIDLEGDSRDDRVAEAIEALRGHCDHVRVMGSYPRG